MLAARRLHVSLSSTGTGAYALCAAQLLPDAIRVWYFRIVSFLI